MTKKQSSIDITVEISGQRITKPTTSIEYGKPSDAPSKVLAGGLAENAKAYKDISRELAEMGHHSVAFDTNFHKYPNKSPDDLKEVQYRTLEEVVLSVGSPVVLFTHSASSISGLRMAQYHADLIKSAVFLTPMCFYGQFLDHQPNHRFWRDYLYYAFHQGKRGVMGLRDYYDVAMMFAGSAIVNRRNIKMAIDVFVNYRPDLAIEALRYKGVPSHFVVGDNDHLVDSDFVKQRLKDYGLEESLFVFNDGPSSEHQHMASRAGTDQALQALKLALR